MDVSNSIVSVILMLKAIKWWHDFPHPSLVWRSRSGRGIRQNFWMRLTPQKLVGWATVRWKLH